jgi:nitroreductase
MTIDFTTISTIIKKRRTVKPFMMNGKKIPNGQITQLLELADWAPTHGLTEPWRFVVYAEPKDFCFQHAEMYKAATRPDDFNESVYNNLRQQGDKASHVIIAMMKRGNLPKIPVFEELAAASCAVENLLLGATALEIASYWGTGGMALKEDMKQFLNLGENDQVIGILYLGYADNQPEGRRNTPLAEKISWV